MVTCPKCRKQNPTDAAFCGFCGAKLAQTPAPGAPSKTVFGYNLDAAELAARDQASASQTAGDGKGDPATGELVAGRFWPGELVQRLAAGELYRAKDVKQDTELDLLLVDASVFPSPLDMERARRELRQLQKVDCASIVKVIDHGKGEDGRLFIAQERVEGAPLDEWIAQGPLHQDEAQRVIREVGAALAEAQKMGVIHRDISPGNILLQQSGEVKVRGFGIAAPIKRHVFGTAEFLSPEQAAGRPVDQRSNIYSLGALMFYLITGEPPFSGSTPDELLEKHQKEEPTAPSARRPDFGISPRMDALILKALAKSSSRRHLTLRQFLREVEALSSGEAAQPEAQPVSFVTPLHGMTSLTGGDRPPSTELPMLGTAPPVADPAPQPAIDAAAITISDAPVQGGPGEAVGPAGGMPGEPPSPEGEAPRTRSTQITGEVSSGVNLKQRPAQAAPEPKKAPPPAAAAPGASPPSGGQPPGFRETMWFFKGEVESAMAETGEETTAPPPEAVVPEDLAVKYTDDGSMSEEEARRLSLRTGKTQMMMQQAVVPSGAMPGKRMAAGEFLDEMNQGKRFAIWAGGFILLAGIAGLVVWLLMK